VQRVGEAPARPADALARRLFGDREQIPKLAERQPGVEAEQEDEPVVRRELGQRLARGAVVGPVDRRGVDRLENGERLAGAPPQLVDGEVRGGPVQPRAQDGRAPRAARAATRGRRPPG
jgi:hypothetical protein